MESGLVHALPVVKNAKVTQGEYSQPHFLPFLRVLGWKACLQMIMNNFENVEMKWNVLWVKFWYVEAWYSELEMKMSQ